MGQVYQLPTDDWQNYADYARNFTFTKFVYSCEHAGTQSMIDEGRCRSIEQAASCSSHPPSVLIIPTVRDSALENTPVQDSFNPYCEWLGIAAADERPNHYQLLGLVTFETDLGKISAAAERQMSRAFKVQASPRLAQWQRVLSELAAAKHVLSDEGEKIRYDEQLRRELAIAGGRAGAKADPWSLATRLPDTQEPAGINWMPPGQTHPVPVPEKPTDLTPEAFPKLSPGLPAHLMPRPAAASAPSALQISALQISIVPSPVQFSTSPAMTPTAASPPAPPLVAPPLAPPLAAPPPGLEVHNPFAPRPTSLDFQYPGAMNAADDEVLPTPSPMYPMVFTPAGNNPASTTNSNATISFSEPADVAATVAQNISTDEVHPVVVAHRSLAPQSRPQSTNQTLIAAASLLVLAGVVGLGVAIAGGFISIGRQVAKTDSANTNGDHTTDQTNEAGTAASLGKGQPSSATRPANGSSDNPVPITAVPINTLPNKTVPKDADSSPKTSDSTATQLLPKPGPTPQPTVEMPKTDPKPSPESPIKPAVDPQQVAKFRAQIVATREALGARNFPEANRHIEQLKALAATEEQQSTLADVEQLQRYTVAFWDVVKKSVKGLPQGELQVGNTFVAVIETGDDLLSYRHAGKNHSYRILEIPSGMAMTLARKWYNDKADNKVFMGAFLFVDPRSEIADAKKLWEEADKAGVPSKGLLALLPYANAGGSNTGGTGNGSAGGMAGTEPVPDTASIVAATGALKQRFVAEYDAATTVPKKAELARKLLAEANKPDVESIPRYCMLREARDLAIDCGQAALAITAVELLTKHFAIDPLDAKAELLGKLSPSSPLVAREIAKTGLEVVDLAIAANRKDLAGKVVELAGAAAIKSQNAPLMKQIKERKDKLAAK